MKHGIKIFIALLFCAGYSYGQFVVSPGTQIAASTDASVTVVTSGDVINQSDNDLAALNLKLTLSGSIQSVEGNFTLNELTLNGPLTTLEGNVTVTGGINFLNGIVRIADDYAFVFVGDGSKVTTDENNPGLSYVDGRFTQQGTGVRHYYVGDGTNYLPLSFLDVQTEQPITVTAKAGSSGMTAPYLDVDAVYQDRYWLVDSDDLNGIQSKVQLYSQGIPVSDGTIVVVEADPVQLEPQNLRNAEEAFGKTATSEGKISKPLLALGHSTDVKLKIHDLITPFETTGDEKGNDLLTIDNLFPENHVIFMDRWGVVLKEWTNYDDQDMTNVAFFQTLTPGNYICIAECKTSSGKPLKQTQMVTLLRTK
jgi:hypothetical protein